MARTRKPDPTAPAAGETDTPPPAATPANAALRLAASLDLTQAEPLHSELVARLARDSDLLIEGQDVERASTPCVQVLAAAAATARARSLNFRLIDASSVLSNAVRDLGLASALDMENAA